MKHFALLLLLLPFTYFGLNAQTWEAERDNMLRAFQENDYEKAIEHGEIAKDQTENKEEFLAAYTGIVSNLAFLYMETGQFEKSENYYLKVLKIIIPILTEDHPITARTHNNIGELYIKMAKPALSEMHLTKARKVRKKLLAPENAENIQTLKNLSELEAFNKNYQAAGAYHDTIYQIHEAVGDTVGLLSALNNKALMLHEAGLTEDALNIYSDLLKKDAIYNPKPDAQSSIYFRNAGLAYRSAGDYHKAAGLFEQFCETIRFIHGDSPDLASALSETGVIYYESGAYGKALEYYKKTETLLLNLSMINTEINIKNLNNFGVLYYSIGNYARADEYYSQAAVIIKNIFSETHLLLAENLNSRAVLYSENGNYDKAGELYRQAEKIHLSQNDINSPEYFALLINMADWHEKNRQFIKAEQYYIKALNLSEEIFGEYSYERLKIDYRLAGFFKLAGKYEIADSLFRVTAGKQQYIFGESHPDYAVTLNNWGSLKISMKEYRKAQSLLKEAAEIKAELFGETHWEYAMPLNNLAALYYKRGKLRKAEKYFRKAGEILNLKTESNFGIMNVADLEAYLKSTDYLYDAHNSFYYQRSKVRAKAGIDLFNNVIYRKSLLLQFERNRRKRVLKDNNPELLLRYNEFLEFRERIGKLQLDNPQKNADSIFVLNELADNVEKQIRELSPDYRRAEQQTVDYKTVRRVLQPGEAVVEFVRFRHYNIMPTDSFLYCALVLRPDFSYPKVVFLFEEDTLKQLLKKNEDWHEHKSIAYLYHRKNLEGEGYRPSSDSLSQQLYRLVWKPIEAALDGAKQVYYSPAGMLHKVSFSAVSDENNSYLSDKYEMRLLTNTGSLTELRNRKERFETAVLFGNIDYDASPNTIAQEAARFSQQPVDYFFSGELFGDLRHESWVHLQGTKEEIDRIAESFKGAGIQSNIYESDKAVEESIKQYSGTQSGPDILHIATHGFFFPDNSASKLNSGNQRSGNDYTDASGPLFRSGLLFSGANRTWNSLDMPESADDGIFTAFEAASLNLISTNLVVLSACETGLGDIDQHEGVYGLQRAFKIAGSQKIIMSLWKVPDKQTVELMTYLYDFIAEGFSVDQSFRKAVDKMKNDYLPYYWAAFVLLE